MIIIRMLGLFLLIGAFLAGAFEMTAQGLVGERSLFMSAWQTWFIHSPETLARARTFVEDHAGAWVWVDVALPLLSVPGWLLLGLPGGLFLGFDAWWRSRRGDGDGNTDEEALFLYDELNRAAHDDGYAEEEADIYTDMTDDIRKSWDHDDHDGEKPDKDRHDAPSPHRPPPTNVGRS